MRSRTLRPLSTMRGRLPVSSIWTCLSLLQNAAAFWRTRLHTGQRFLARGSTVLEMEFCPRKGVPIKALVVGAVVAIVVSAICVPVARGQEEDSISSSRDHLVGWYNLPNRHYRTRAILPGPGTLIPVFKIDHAYYSVCRGFEVPLKECPEGLEWAVENSSMAGTTIGFDDTTDEFYIRIVDNRAQYEGDCSTSGEKQGMTRIDPPSWLPDPTARRPRCHEEFIGVYQPVWFPYPHLEIRKEGMEYFAVWKLDQRGAWDVEERRELAVLTDRWGFTGFDRKNRHRLAYNEELERYEITKEASPVVRMPLARVTTAGSSSQDSGPPPMAIGIPSWH